MIDTGRLTDSFSRFAISFLDAMEAFNLHFGKNAKRYRHARLRRGKKQPLLEGQRGRTHKRKQRGTRKRDLAAQRALQRLKTMDYDMYSAVYEACRRDKR